MISVAVAVPLLALGAGQPVLHHVLNAAAAADGISNDAPAPSPSKKKRKGSDGKRAGAASDAARAASAAEWYANYCVIALRGALRLWLCYGVTLELHQQNSLLIFSEDQERELKYVRQELDEQQHGERLKSGVVKRAARALGDAGREAARRKAKEGSGEVKA